MAEPIDAAFYQKVLGDEIRLLRKNRGLTRKQLRARLQDEASLQTFATYELGTRACSVVRFVEICLALNELPHEVLARVHERLYGGDEFIAVDLHKVMKTEQPELEPLRRWARTQSTPGARRIVRLTFSALSEMARLCGVEPVGLIGMLRE